MTCAGVCIIKSRSVVCMCLKTKIPSCIPKLKYKLTFCICSWYLATTWTRALGSTLLLKLRPTTVGRQLNYLPPSVWQSNNLGGHNIHQLILCHNWYCVSPPFPALHCLSHFLNLLKSQMLYDFQTIEHLRVLSSIQMLLQERA